MAQGMMPESAVAACARGDLGDRVRPRPEAAPSAYGGIEAGRLVVLAKPMASNAGYYQPFAVVRFEDLPEELRRQIAGASGHGAAAPVAAPLCGEGDARYHAAHPVEVIVPEEGLRRQLPGLVSGPNDERTVKFAGDGNSDTVVKDYSERGILRLMEEDGKVMACLNASRLQVQVLGDMEGSLFKKEKGFSHAWMGHSGDEVRAAHAYMGAFYDNSFPAREDAAPVVVLLLGNNHIAAPRTLDCSNGLTSPREDAVPFITKQGVYYDNVLVPPENVVPAADTYAVQVWVGATAGGKAGDPTAVGVKAAGAGAGHEHGGSLSAVLGVVVASSAATTLAAGTLGPAMAFRLLEFIRA